MPRRSVTAGDDDDEAIVISCRDDDDEAIVARTIPQRERELVDSRFSLSSLECVFGFRGRDAARARCATRSRETTSFISLLSLFGTTSLWVVQKKIQ